MTADKGFYVMVSSFSAITEFSSMYKMLINGTKTLLWPVIGCFCWVAVHFFRQQLREEVRKIILFTNYQLSQIVVTT